MQHPFVSILMPAYNVEKYIAIAIKGILQQIYTNFELVIINDGSTDNTEQVIKSFTDDRIKYFYQENQGVAASLNNGLKKCKGKYIRRHDADDLSTPNALAEQVDFIEQNNEYALISTRIAYMTENNRISKKYTNPNSTFFNGKSFFEVTKDNYWEKRPIIHATILIKKDIFKIVGDYRTEFPTSEDIDLWFRILDRYKVAVLNQISYFVRIHHSSNTQVHGYENKFYRDLAYQFAIERQNTGSDPLMRGEEMPKPPKKKDNYAIKQTKLLSKQKKMYRNDILDYQYRIFVDAKDWKLVWKSIKTALKCGWKLKQTWKAILFPLLGERIVGFGVKIKRAVNQKKQQL